MFGKRQRAEDECSWPVLGVDIPYPPAVVAALERVAAETRRRLRETCEHDDRKQISHLLNDVGFWEDTYRCRECWYEWTTCAGNRPYTWQTACSHERTERFVQRTANGTPCTDAARCLDCGADVPWAQAPSMIPIMLEVDAGASDSFATFLMDRLLVDTRALVRRSQELTPRDRGPLRRLDDSAVISVGDDILTDHSWSEINPRKLVVALADIRGGY